MGGGIGDIASRFSYKYDKKEFYIKLIWNSLFHLLVNLILGNIFFGVIVEAFNELKEKNSKKEEDMKNKCFMCNRDKYDDNYKEEFEYHRKTQHHIFNYVYFIPYLLKKNPQEYSRAEQYSWEKINSNNMDWFPDGKNNENNDTDNDD